MGSCRSTIELHPRDGADSTTTPLLAWLDGFRPWGNFSGGLRASVAVRCDAFGQGNPDYGSHLVDFNNISLTSSSELTVPVLRVAEESCKLPTV